MKLWEIKAQALRLMFADTDIDFSEEEFTNGSVYVNNNTREKLVRMDDSIRRGIDLYYQHVGESTKVGKYSLAILNNETMNYIDVNEEMFGFPTRVEVFIGGSIAHVDFMFDELDKRIYFIHKDFTIYDGVFFHVWYKTAKMNIPLTVNEMDYDLDTIFIPTEVQRMLPFYVKGELYEEDEPSVAMNSRNTYIQFLYGIRKPFSRVQTKVKRANVFNK